MKRFVRQFLARSWRSAAPDVVVQRRLHNTLFSLSLRDHALWIFLGDSADAEQVPIPSFGHVWDLGCNIGLYSVQAALAGCRVSAFDISSTNVLCVNQTAKLNALDIHAYLSPVTVEESHWTPARTGHTEEAMTRGGALLSTTYLQASERCGVPSFIKFDIQGGEIEFLKSHAFRGWVHDNRISVYLEAHDGAEEFIWPEFKKIGPIHYWIGHSEKHSTAISQ
jgi:FkbM family methyltransferase